MTLESSEVQNCPWRISTILALPLRQTNDDKTQNGSEDDLLISKIQSLHLLLEVDDHDEEEYTVVLTLVKP